ncbi:AAA family ATPase [Desulfobacterales bacterium HSG16]|nr:AAA family ATPase [Desulfobacterales bacterium HSG16]
MAVRFCLAEKTMKKKPSISGNPSESMPDPKEIEKEIGEFLAKKFGGDVKIVTPIEMPQEMIAEVSGQTAEKKEMLDFDLIPEDLFSYLDQYIVRQDEAKSVLATKICTHFNRIKHQHARVQSGLDEVSDIVGTIKNNVLMIGPTGVGKTYMVKLIAKKLGVPFVKGDATKFSETGYVGGDVEDLIRDLVREADGDIEMAGYGIIYIDEIDKIASSRNLIGSDISRTGVQRALLKPMEETEVELKVPHDPISMIQEIERFRKTGKRDQSSVNTKNILFIMSGAFSDLGDIIYKRLAKQKIGFGATLAKHKQNTDILRHTRSEDLVEFGFESEFIGRLPVHAVFEHLSEDDLYKILKNPNNPVILSKKLDFAAYGIDIKFEDEALKTLAKRAFEEHTGARGLVSSIENALLLFEKTLPSTLINLFPVTLDVIENPENALKQLTDSPDVEKIQQDFNRLAREEKAGIKDYIEAKKKELVKKHSLSLTLSHIEIATEYYTSNIVDIGTALKKIKHFADEVKKIELFFYKNHDINFVMEEDAIDFFIEQLVKTDSHVDDIYEKLSKDFEYGLKLARDKTGRNRFFITKEAILNPETYIGQLIKEDLKSKDLVSPKERLEQKL